MSDLGKQFGERDDDWLGTGYGGGVKSSTFYPSAAGGGNYDFDNDINEDLMHRKKAWAELEREQDEVKSNIKSLMRKAPESQEMDNPLLADRIGQR